jgi:tripartite-type tricarboxylate transporter receptor subunit TctC
MRRFVRLLGLAAAVVSVTAAAQAAHDYPSRQLRMIIPFGPGGASDTVARALQPKLERILGHEVIFEHRPGAAGNIGMELAARAAPDGYTLFLGNVGAVAINPSVFGAELKVDPLRDFIAVTIAAEVPGLLVVNPAFPAKTVREFVEYARAHPGQVSFASSGAGAVSRLDMERLRVVEKLEMTHVPYRAGAAQAVTDLIGGHVPAMFVTISSALRQVQAGKLRALAVTSAYRVAALPDVPTMVESGYADFVSNSWQGIFVPAGTPEPVVRKLHASFAAALGDAEVRHRFDEASARAVASESPAEFARFVGAEATRWSELVKRAGATPE